MPRDDAADLGAKLDRISYLLVVVIAFQLIEFFDLGATGLSILAVVGFFLAMLYNADV